MKKFVALLCMIACIFGLAACGSGETLSDYGQQKLDYAKQLATEMIVPMLSQFEKDAAFDEYTVEEIEYMLGNQYSMNVRGSGFVNALESFQSAKEEIGEITEISGSSASIDDKTIVVEVDVKGEKKNATAEIIFSNDMFFYLESASLNPVSGIGEMMSNAGLNTLIGMGTVFVVLILISFIISRFKIISNIQDNAARKKAANETSAAAVGVGSAVARIEGQEAAADETDDCELVAVIAAAIAAGEGAATTDGFVVRSIRRRR